MEPSSVTCYYFLIHLVLAYTEHFARIKYLNDITFKFDLSQGKKNLLLNIFSLVLLVIMLKLKKWESTNHLSQDLMMLDSFQWYPSTTRIIIK